MVEIPESLADSLRRAGHVMVLTGAGCSAESGVPTFREAQTGLWAQYEPEKLATPGAFQQDPQLVWEWYVWRRALVAQASPNPGHYALAALAALVPKLTLATQNVDGLHQAAGSREVLELHGSISRILCFDCGAPDDGWRDDQGKAPLCAVCGGRLRPDVVWFGENLPRNVLVAAGAAAADCDLFLSVGTSAVVQPAASLPVAAKESGAVVVEINPNPTPLTSLVDYHLEGPSGELLPALVAAMRQGDQG